LQGEYGTGQSCVVGLGNFQGAGTLVEINLMKKGDGKRGGGYNPWGGEVFFTEAGKFSLGEKKIFKGRAEGKERIEKKSLVKE